MTSVSIRRHELRQYQASEISPRLPGWTDLGDRGVMRREGFLIQRLALYRFAHWGGFRIHYSVQLTIVPGTELHSTIGGTLHHWSPRWPGIPWVGQRWRELWVKWEERLEWSERIIALAREQVEPSISEPLTLAAVAALVSRREAVAPDNVYLAWPAAMLRALLGHREQARTDLVNLRARVSAWVENAARETPERVGEHDREIVRQLGIAIDALASAAAFEQYCSITNKETEEAIGLPSLAPS